MKQRTDYMNRNKKVDMLLAKTNTSTDRNYQIISIHILP